MRPSILSSGLVLITTFAPSSVALQAISNSPCAAKCGNVLDETNGVDHITCVDREYATTSKGSVFQNCINCQLTSKYVDPTTRQTDLQWALYNLRYAVSWCLFGFPNNKDHNSSPCITSTACGTLENAFEFDSLSPNATAYGYCALMHEETLPKCNACVAQSDEFYVTNFITALSAACKQQPILGATISIEGNLFSDIRANITDPNATAASHHKAPSGGLPLGAIVGITIGSLALLLTTLGCCIVWRGRKRRRAVIASRQKETGYADWISQQVTQQQQFGSPISGHDGRSPGPFFDSPVSARPLINTNTGWGRAAHDEESPSNAYPGAEKTFSPYTSQYSSPVSAVDSAQVLNREWPSERPGNYNNPQSFSAQSSFSRARAEKEMMADRIEMQNVAPVLLHPGMGRHG